MTFCITCDTYFEDYKYYRNECFNCRKERAIKSRERERELEAQGFIIKYRFKGAVLNP